MPKTKKEATIKKKDTLIMLKALHVEYNRMFFEGQLKIPEIKLRVGKAFESKWVKNHNIIVVNKKYMLMSNDTPESTAVKVEGMGKALRQAMVLQYFEQVESRKPIKSKRFHKLVEAMDVMKIVRT